MEQNAGLATLKIVGLDFTPLEYVLPREKAYGMARGLNFRRTVALVTVTSDDGSVGYGEALAIESVGQAVRAAGFLIPGALGVQEAGFIAVCAVYGIPAAEALALSLVKRVPDLTIGLPFLFVWHAHETRALIRRGPVRS